MSKKSYALTTDKGTKCEVVLEEENNRFVAYAEWTPFFICHWDLNEVTTAEELAEALNNFIKTLKSDY